MKQVKKPLIILLIFELIASVINIFNPIVNAKLLTYLTSFEVNKAYKYAIVLLFISTSSIIINRLTIAHRLSTIENSDRIYLIEDGSIIGEVPHKQLLKTNKHYKELYKK